MDSDEDFDIGVVTERLPLQEIWGEEVIEPCEESSLGDDSMKAA